MLTVLPTDASQFQRRETSTQNHQNLRDVAIKLEATFLSEMLKSAGMGESRGDLGGGVGEDQFGSFLRDAQALEMAKVGGVGLADALFEVLVVRAHV